MTLTDINWREKLRRDRGREEKKEREEDQIWLFFDKTFTLSPLFSDSLSLWRELSLSLSLLPTTTCDSLVCWDLEARKKVNQKVSKKKDLDMSFIPSSCLYFLFLQRFLSHVSFKSWQEKFFSVSFLSHIKPCFTYTSHPFLDFFLPPLFSLFLEETFFFLILFPSHSEEWILTLFFDIGEKLHSKWTN